MKTRPDALPEPKLLLFDALYDIHSVTSAAEQLDQSQPTVSLWLGKLRRQLGDPLFVRTPDGMVPTPQAEALVTPCREVLESLRRLTAWERDFDPATAQRRFRLCISDASHITLLPAILERLRRTASGIRLEVARIDGNTERALETGEADLAIGFVPLAGRRHLSTGAVSPGLGVPGQRRASATAGVAGPAGLRRRGPRAGERRHRPEAAGGGADAAGTEAASGAGVAGLWGRSSATPTCSPPCRATSARPWRAAHGLQVLACPLPQEGFSVKQHWHARYHQDSGNRWLRGLIQRLFGASAAG